MLRLNVNIYEQRRNELLNHIIIMGRLTRDPELRRTGSGVACANFSIAVVRDFADKQTGTKETDFVDIVAWRQTGEFVSKYFTKGRMIVVSGRLQIRSWTDKDGNKRKTAEVVADSCYFGDSKSDNAQQGGMQKTVASPYATPYPETEAMLQQYGANPAADFALLNDDDAQLPF
jgi:single-strand DNA-binding protein